jgi:hypothetical protein
MLIETYRPSMHDQTYDLEGGEEEAEEQVDDNDEADSLPLPIT